MAPSAKKLEEALLDGTYEVYSASPDETTVNKVRKHVEEKFGLEDGFLSSAKWKAKSKTLIKARVEKLMDGWVPESKDEPDSNVPSKRRSSEVTSPASKRRKPAPKAKNPPKKVESDLSELGELSEEDKPQPKKKKAVTSHQSRKVESDDDELSEPPSVESLDFEPKQDKEAKKDKDDENEPTSLKDEKPLSNVKLPVITLGDAVEDSDAVTTKPAIDEEEEYSDVIDEPPKPKRKKKEKTEKKQPSSKSAKSAKVATKKASISEDPQEAEIKKLQSQLIKCGIRKLWHNELKKYGDDSRAKIRHLKKMLSDVGMDGRFSEAKAREVKEMRELMAEAEAAKEMNALWGMDNGGRASRSKSKTSKTVESEASGDEDEEEEEDNTYAARRKRAQADLAFLGDESDSD